MSFLNLVKGNENNLQGKVIVYSILKSDNYLPNLKNGEIFSLYGSNDIKDFVEKINPSIESIRENLLETKINDAIVKLFGIHIEIQNFNISPIEIENEELIRSFESDVLFAGNYQHPSLCGKSINVGIEFYTIKLMEQDLKRTYNQQKSTQREGLENIPTGKLEALKMELQKMIKLENFDAAKVIKSQIDDLLEK